MVFLDRRLRGSIPEVVAILLANRIAWNEYVRYDKSVILIGEACSYRVQGDWFQGQTG